MTEIYLDPKTCSELELLYWEGHEDNTRKPAPTSIHVGDLLSSKRLWDYQHRSLFSKFVLSGELMWVRPSSGPGWFEVMNTSGKPFYTKEPATFDEVLRAD